MFGKPRPAAEKDYRQLQGGVPAIEQRGRIWRIVHNYPGGDGMEVITHISPKRRGTVIINGVEYETAKLRQFEGGPCERLSRLAGGEGYARRR